MSNLFCYFLLPGQYILMDSAERLEGVFYVWAILAVFGN